MFQLLSFISPLSVFLAFEVCSALLGLSLRAVTNSPQLTLGVVEFSLAVAVCTHKHDGENWCVSKSFQKLLWAVSHTELTQPALRAPYCFFMLCLKGL